MWFSHWVWGKPYARPFRCAIKCFSLSEDFLSPVAFSINSSQTDKSLSIGPDSLYRSSYSPQVRRYLAHRLDRKPAACHYWQMKAIWILTTVYTPCWETKLDLWGSGTQSFYCAEEIWEPSFPVVTHPNSLMSQPAPSSSSSSSSVDYYLFPPAVVMC